MTNDYCQHFTNQLEFTIHGLEEFDISRSTSPDEEEILERDDDVATQLVSEQSSTMELSLSESNSTSTSTDSNEGEAQLKSTLEERTSLQESKLLQDLKTMKEEVWAKRKARKMRREMKRVQFLDEAAVITPFCRSCCSGSGRKSGGGPFVSSGNLSRAKRESETNSISGESSNSSDGTDISVRLEKGAYRTTSKQRPIVHIHSINMYQNIIPRQILESKKCHQQSFIPLFSTPLVKMLADIV